MSDINLFNLLKAMATLAPKNDVRYYLNGVLVRKLGSKLTVSATDGHKLARFDGASPLPHSGIFEFDKADSTIEIIGDGDVVLDKLTLLAILKLFNKKTYIRVVINTITQTCTINDQPLKIIDGKYPDIDRVTRVKNSGGGTDEIGVNLDDFADIQRFFKIALGRKINLARINIPTNASESLLVEAVGLKAVIMPVRL